MRLQLGTPSPRCDCSLSHGVKTLLGKAWNLPILSQDCPNSSTPPHPLPRLSQLLCPPRTFPPALTMLL